MVFYRGHIIDEVGSRESIHTSLLPGFLVQGTHIFLYIEDLLGWTSQYVVELNAISLGGGVRSACVILYYFLCSYRQPENNSPGDENLFPYIPCHNNKI